MTPITKRRLSNFRANKRAYWSLWLFAILFIISLFAEFIANDKPILVRYDGDLRMPIFRFYSEKDFGGVYDTEADYLDPVVQCFIVSGGDNACITDPEKEGDGFLIWPLVRYKFDTVIKGGDGAYNAPSSTHWFGTDGQPRDVFARVIYGFRLTVFFALIVSSAASAIAIVLGAIMGYFGGRVDLIMQRLVEIWTTMPTFYVMMVIASLITVNFFSISLIVTLFMWTGLVGLVRAEFLRARNFEYVRAAKALGVSDVQIMWRHVLPNAMVATITYMPFIITGAIGTLATLDFFNLGLPDNYPSLGHMAREAAAEQTAWWLIWAAFITYTVILTLFVFIFEGIRDAFDPKKVFQ